MTLAMKQWSRAAMATVLSLCATVSWALAQDQTGGGGTAPGGTTTTTTSTQVWYGNWWIWAVGIAVFLIVVIALTNRGGRTRV